MPGGIGGGNPPTATVTSKGMGLRDYSAVIPPCVAVFLHELEVFRDVGFVHREPVIQRHIAVFGVMAGVGSKPRRAAIG